MDAEPKDGGVDADLDLDLDARQLCADGACTGVVGADGRCRVCGGAADALSASPAPGVSGSEPAPMPESAAASREAPGEAELDLEDRRLCPDGACLGLLGPDGRCKIC